jgi:DNA-binding CsgD family transcriptional regulator
VTRDQKIRADWLEVAVAVIEDPASTEFPAELVADQLMTCFRSDGCAYTNATASTDGSQMWPPQFWGGPEEYDNAAIAARESTAIHPIVQYYAAAGPDAGPVQIADVPRRFHEAWRSRGMDSYYRDVGVPHHLSFPLDVLQDSQRAFVLGRATPFSAAEMASTRFVHRLLLGIEKHVSVMRSLARGSGPIEDGPLSPRQTAVLDLVARGLTASAVGRKLGITEGTVNKHLQGAYRTLGVSDRLSAVAAAQRARVLPAFTTHF